MRLFIAAAAMLVIGLQLLSHNLRHLADVSDSYPRWLAVTTVALDAGLLLFVLLWFLAPVGRR